MKNLWALAVLRLAAAAVLSATPETAMEAVPLVTVAPTERAPVVRKASRELLESLGYAAEPDEDGLTTDEEYDDDTTSAAPAMARRRGVAASWGNPENRTKLYPVGRLWDWTGDSPRRIDEERTDPAQRTGWSAQTTPITVQRAGEAVLTTDVSDPEPDGSLERTLPPRPMGMMALLDAAFSCLWSGLGFECFSLKVVPMFRAMMGFPPVHPFGHPYYVLPRTTDAELRKSQEEDEAEDEESEEDDADANPTGRRRRRRHFGLKMVKMGLMGLAALKTFLLPALSVLSIASGKAIVFSLAAVVLTLAVGWSAAKSADRRVYDSYQPPQYYM